MIKFENNIFTLETKNTLYSFCINEIGYLRHLYYGKKCEYSISNLKKMDGCIYYSKDFQDTIENMPLEYSGIGKGDTRQPMIVATYADGSYTNDFVCKSYEINNGKTMLQTLPCSYGADQELIIHLVEYNNGLEVDLRYGVYYENDFLTRSVKIINNTGNSVTLNKVESLQIDFEKTFDVTSFNGVWGYEVNKHTTKLTAGRYEVSSSCGYTSSRANPFIMLSNNADEYHGEVYGFNIIYGGNHYECLDVDYYQNTRLLIGINPDMFEYRLNSLESFESPEVIFSYSDEGFNGLSSKFHSFINNHIVRGKYKNATRPFLINSWEGNLMDIDEDKLANLAMVAKRVGLEMLVMDDGWFKGRNDDHTSLGDWVCDQNKFPLGLAHLANRINQIGLKFGIWVEPEMISVNSDVYRAHPNWAIEYKNHSEGRNQRIMDLCNPEVVSYIIQSISNILDSANIEYVKWDCNRIFSDVYSPYMGTFQKETMHRYYISLNTIMKTLTEKYPNVLFEGCASGGNRFDLQTLCYFPQIWASDNTDAICRKRIQTSYSYGYPQSCFTNHVSASPNLQTGKATSLQNRYKVAMAGNLGYELDLTKCNEEELQEIAKQVAIYKKYRRDLQYGSFKRYQDGWLIGDDNKLYFDLKDVTYNGNVN